MNRTAALLKYRLCAFVLGLLILPLLTGACVLRSPAAPDPTTAPPTNTPSQPAGDFETRVNESLHPEVLAVLDAQGNLLPAAASLDDQGVQSDFVEGVVLVRPASDAVLQDFLDRYEGVVIDDNTIPEPPEELGITLTEEQRKPTEYVVRINLSRAGLDSLPQNAALVELEGTVEFSSQSGLETFAAVLDAKAAGFDAGANWIDSQEQAPTIAGSFAAMFNTQERQNAPPTPGFKNALNEPRYAATGSQSNVALAMQYLAAHGFQRRVWVAIIDSGFYLDNNGVPIGADSDFLPAGNNGRPVQYDFTDDDAFAGGPGPMNCSSANPCWWHGTGATGAAAGTMDNRRGEAGTGGMVANQMLFRVSGARDQRNEAVRTAVAWGADVVSMSFGGDCNRSCRVADRDDNPFDDAVNGGSRVVFFAAAGNGRGSPAVGYPVGDPNFYHPCIEDRTICVGALNNNALTKTGYSNFGDQVGIFAPTNIPVMSYPPSTGVDAAGNPVPLPASQAFGTAAPQSFGGTSAATPFVAGVAAMMKAINPNLNHDDVSRILIETARPGTAPVTRTLDALAAVRRAAVGIPNLPDRFEPNDLEGEPANLGSAPPFSLPNLSISSRDRDYFRFNSAGGADMTISLQYPVGLSTVSIFNLQSLGGDCAAPVLLNDAVIANPDGTTGHSYTYRVPGGPLRLGLSSNEVNAYHLNITFAAAPFAADRYEPNDTPAAARNMFAWTVSNLGVLNGLKIDPRFSIVANLHHAADVDFYIVRGGRMTLAEQVLLVGNPALVLSGNDSPVDLQVFALQADGTPGAQLANLRAASCMPKPIVVPLKADTYYLVRVSGGQGAYTLQNGISAERRRLPVLVRDRMYEILHPGEPVEKVLDFDRYYVLNGDYAVRSIQIENPQVRLSLFDMEGSLLAEGGAGDPLSLAELQVGQMYALLAVPEPGIAEPPVMALSWEAADPLQRSENLIANPGAEIVEGEGNIPGWEVMEGFAEPRLYFYDESEENPSPEGPGPEDRGFHLFAGGAEGELSAIQQTISIDPHWQGAIDEGRVKFSFGAFLGGKLLEEDYAFAALVFLDAEGQELGRVELPSITARERDGQSGLFPAAVSDYLLAGTSQIRVVLSFHGFEGGFNDGYADNLELELFEYSP